MGDVLVEYAPDGHGIHTAVYIVYSDGQCKLTDLPLFGGAHAIGTAISNDGVVTGYGVTGDNRTHAFLYDDAGIGNLTPLAGSSMAFDINNINHVVGTMDNRAFWSNNGCELIDLNTLIDPDADLFLTAAVSINDRDQILAKAATAPACFATTPSP